ncbi:MAG: hypothetical protein NC211_04425 [Alistipes senegalensis]|nr:hypothetical protein [Oxalobacter formigenes]MCM1281063.1 hypothetical protein [Alistipes senegalensis]
MVVESVQIQKENVSAPLQAQKNIHSPQKHRIAKKRRNSKTVLERKTAEKATGSQ